MQSTKAIKRRLQSITSVGQLTKAMEMISTIKMRHCLEALAANRPFSHQAWELLARLIVYLSRQQSDFSHPFFETKNKDNSQPKQLIILLSDNRGLCGGFHSHLFKTLENLLVNSPTITPEFISLGSKGTNYLKKNHHQILASHDQVNNEKEATNQTQIFSDLTQLVINSFLSGQYRQIYLVTTNYVNAMVQTPIAKMLAPLDLNSIGQQFSDQTFATKAPLAFFEDQAAPNEDQAIKKTSHPSKNSSTSDHNPTPSVTQFQNLPGFTDYQIDSSLVELIDSLLPFCLQAQIFQAFLESRTSAEAARVLAMKNANDAADDITHDLQLVYNQLRQGKITQEIAEIAGARLALEN